jgi:hypothetical protein
MPLRYKKRKNMKLKKYLSRSTWVLEKLIYERDDKEVYSKIS